MFPSKKITINSRNACTLVEKAFLVRAAELVEDARVASAFKSGSGR